MCATVSNQKPHFVRNLPSHISHTHGDNIFPFLSLFIWLYFHFAGVSTVPPHPSLPRRICLLNDDGFFVWIPWSRFFILFHTACSFGVLFTFLFVPSCSPHSSSLTAQATQHTLMKTICSSGACNPSSSSFALHIIWACKIKSWW